MYRESVFIFKTNLSLRLLYNL